MHSIVTQGIVLAAGGAGTAPSFLNSGHLKGLLIFIFGILVMLGAVFMALKGHKSKFRENAETGGNYLLASVVFAIGASAVFYKFGNSVASFFFN